MVCSSVSDVFTLRGAQSRGENMKTPQDVKKGDCNQIIDRVWSSSFIPVRVGTALPPIQCCDDAVHLSGSQIPPSCNLHLHTFPELRQNCPEWSPQKQENEYSGSAHLTSQPKETKVTHSDDA